MGVTIRLPATLRADGLDALARALDNPDDDAVLVLRGATPETFCNGLDLELARSRDAAPTVLRIAEVLAALADGIRPTIAVVEGAARGGGVGVAAACDAVVAVEGSTFALTELLFGLVPAAIWPILALRVREATLRRWVKTAEPIGVAEARVAGLVDVVCSPDELEATVVRLIKSMRRVQAPGLQRLRTLCRSNRPTPLRDAILDGARTTAASLSQPDVVAALDAFARGEIPWRT